MIDRKKVMSWLEGLAEPDWRVFHSDSEVQNIAKSALALLKEQEAQKFFVDESGKITPLPVVVRCKDCKWRGNKKMCIVAFVADKQEFPLFFYDNRGNWFCADGERREDT